MNTISSFPDLSDKKLQGLIQELSSYGLGVCVPHSHKEDGSIVDLPVGMVSVEQDLKVSFMLAEEVEKDHFVPIAWRWESDGVNVVSLCCKGPSSN